MNTNLGIEYYLTEKSSLTASGFLRLGDDEDTTTNLTQEFNASNALAVERSRIETETEEDTSLQFSLNYVNNFDDSGHKLTVDLQAEDDKETETSFIDEFNTFPTTELLPAELITQKENQNEYLVQADYVRPIGENAQFEIGYRGNFEKTETDYLLTEQLTANGAFVRNDSLSNVFTYEENVNALYTQYGNKFGKFSFLLGLRLEDTQLKGNVTGEDITM